LNDVDFGVLLPLKINMKKTKQGGNFSNILSAAFAPLLIILLKKLQCQTVITEKLRKILSYRKLLIKCW